MPSSFVAKLNPSFKLIIHLIAMSYFVFVNHPLTSFLLAVVPFVLMILLARLKIKTILLRTAPFLLFFVLSTWILTAYGKGETVWWQWGWIRITQEGFNNGLNIGFRMLGFVFYGLLFSLTTDITRFTLSLMQQCRLQPKWAYAILAGFRFLPMFREEYEQIKAAHRIRGVKQVKGLRGKVDSILRFTIPLLAQAIRKAERVAVALEARGFDGSRNRTYYHTITYGWRDAAYFMLILICNTFLLWIE